MTGPDLDTSVVQLQLDGAGTDLEVPTDETLLETLRSRGVTSVRGTCGIGVCGTCTVLLDGRAISSCIALTVQADGREVTTSQGLLGPDGSLSRVQQAFVDRGAYQCSFCIPAMVLTVHAELAARAHATVEDVREALGGNLCRCGTYPEVLQAVAQLLAGSDDEGGDVTG